MHASTMEHLLGAPPGRLAVIADEMVEEGNTKPPRH